MNDDVEEIKQRIDIVELISSYLTLKKAGANYRALCPFHNEKTPSLMISPEKQIFKCFGCNEGGDIFSFIMKMENLEFREALEMLAQKARVKLKKFEARNPKFETNGYQNSNIQYQNTVDRKSRLFRINSIVAHVYHKILTSHPSGKIALKYLHQRGITDNTIKDFLIGFSPSSRAIKSYLLKKSFTEQEIQNAGGPDRFYRRIIFPITDVMGNVLGFTGRSIEPEQEPKYLNTPETTIFHKGRILYNLNRARGEIKLKKTTVVVEGQMDVISSYQAGVKNVVATSGTALTEEHLRILYRYTPNITFSFDFDNAGLATAKKAYEMALAQGFNVKMTELGKFKDPGEMIESKAPIGGAKLWQKTVEEAKPVIDWYFNLAFARKSEIRNPKSETETELTSQQKKEIAREILPVIAKIPDTIEQADYIGKLAKKLELKEEIVFAALEKHLEKAKIGQKNQQINGEAKNLKSHQEKEQLTTEEIFIGILVKNSELIEKYLNKIKISDISDRYRNVYRIVEKWYNHAKDSDLNKYLKQELSNDEFQKLNVLLLEISEKYHDSAPKIADDVSRKILADKKELIKEKFAQKIKEAESAGDIDKLKKIIQEFQDAIK